MLGSNGDAEHKPPPAAAGSGSLLRGEYPTGGGKGTVSEQWGATPPLRRLWSINSSSALQLENLSIERAASTKGLISFPGVGYSKIPGDQNSSHIELVDSGQSFSRYQLSRQNDGASLMVPDADAPTALTTLGSFASAAPGVGIAIIINLFLSISFGSAFFPANWVFPPTVSRALGTQMFLLSTVIGQIVMTFTSEFDCAISMQMIENLTFMTTISLSAIKKQGMGEAAFATVFMANAIMSISVGICFYLCGFYKAGYILNIIPKSLILGCIGGIGIFIAKTGVEVSSGQTFAFTGPTAAITLWKFWGASALFEGLLRSLQHWNASSASRGSQFSQTIGAVLAPLYFCAIPFIFYFLLWILRGPLGLSIAIGSVDEWFFPVETGEADYAACFRLLDVSRVDFGVIAESVPTIIASTVFAFLHVPVNIPALRVTTGQNVDMDQELKAHGISNLLAGALGQCQNYLCYSNSVLYYKCQGRGKMASLAVAAASLVFFFAGPSIISLVPRVMPGCLLLHIGFDLLKEAVVDSLAGFDSVEYIIIVSLTLITATLGMTVGLCVGVITAALAFVVQTNLYINPIRRQARCTTMRSNQWRSVRAQRLLPALNRRVLWLQLQGSLFFANAQLLGKELDGLILQSNNSGDRLLMVVLDFSLVLGIDSSAVDAIKDLVKVSEMHQVAVVYVRGSKAGFPCAATLTESLRHIRSPKLHPAGSSCPVRKTASSTAPATKTTSQEVLAELEQTGYSGSLYIVDDLNAAVMLCEERLLYTHTDLKSQPAEIEFQRFLREEKPHFYQLLHIVPNPRQLARLMGYFSERHVHEGEVLWQQGDSSSCALLLVSGLLRSDESELSVEETISPGHLVGEFGLLKGDHRNSSLQASQDSVVMELNLSSYTQMQTKDPEMVILLNRICLAYLDARTRHVSNFLFDSCSLPV